MPYAADDTRWPIVFDVMSGESSDDDVARYNAQRKQRLLRQERHVQVIDAREGKAMGAAHRRLIGDFNAANRQEQSQYLVGVAMVTKSAIARGIMTAIYWVSRPSYQHEICGDLDEAMRWAREMLTAARGER